jgi:hypothetical protein
MQGRARKATVVAAAAILGCAMAQPAQAMRAYVNYDSLVISADPGEVNSLTVRPHPITPGAFLIVDTGAKIAPGAGCTKTAMGRVAVCTIDPEYAYGPPSLSLHLYDGDDTASVEGSFGIVQVDGGTGSDRLDVPGSNGYGYTHIQLGAGDDALELSGAFGAQVEVYGGDGNDNIDAADLAGGYVYGERGNDTIKANGLVSGGDGADTLDGTENVGWDQYFGDAGNDTIDTADFSFDVVDCGLGTDRATPDESDQVTNCEL